jgi:GTP-binding protein HflX
VDISNPNFEDQIKIVNSTIAEIGASNKPMLIIFNKIDAYTYIQKDDDDLTDVLKENLSLEDLKKSWMANLDSESLFISALNKTNFEQLRERLYSRVKELHIKRYPYNNFLY